MRRSLLIASLALNVGFLAFFSHRGTETAKFWYAKVAATPTPTPPPEGEPDEVLGEAPTPEPGYMARMAAEAPRPVDAYAGQQGLAHAAWRRAIREDLDDLLGAGRGPVQAIRPVSRKRFPAVVREKRWLKMADGLWVPAYLLKPIDPPGRPARPRPGVIALPGHDTSDPGWGKGAFDVADAVVAKNNYMLGFGMKLAEAGYVVLAPEVAGVGELAYLEYVTIARRGSLLGEPMLGRVLGHVRAATDVLRAEPGVDPARVGIGGLSLGGLLASYAAARDEDMAFAFSAGSLQSYAYIPTGGMPIVYVPGHLRKLDYPDVLGAIAPRPLLIQIDPADKINAAWERLPAYEGQVRAAFAGAGAADALTIQRHGLRHAIDLPALLAWIERVAPVP